MYDSLTLTVVIVLILQNQKQRKVILVNFEVSSLTFVYKSKRTTLDFGKGVINNFQKSKYND